MYALAAGATQDHTYNKLLRSWYLILWLIKPIQKTGTSLRYLIFSHSGFLNALGRRVSRTHVSSLFLTNPESRNPTGGPGNYFVTLFAFRRSVAHCQLSACRRRNTGRHLPKRLARRSKKTRQNNCQ
jgi:hypothetical protein